MQPASPSSSFATCSLPHAVLQALANGPLAMQALRGQLGCDAQPLEAAMAELHGAGAVVSDAVQPDVWRLQPGHDWLSLDAILPKLGDPEQMQLHALHLDWCLPSTNAELLQHPAPAAGAMVLLAEGQQQGRGRRGRRWASPLGMNLYLSVLRRFEGPPARLAGVALATGVAVLQALHSLGVSDAQLKWPNDVLVDGRKLAGVLVESGTPDTTAGLPLVIGIGINVHMPVDAATSIDQPWTDLHTVLGHGGSRNRVAAALLQALLPALAMFDAAGLAPFLAAYGRHDGLRGRPVRVHGGAGVHRDGIAMGIAPDGALLLADAQGRQWPVHAGEVSVRPA